MTNRDVLKESIKQLIKYLVWSQLKYEQGEKKNIFIFTSRRSGGTWLTEIIARQKGIRQISEPFALNHVAYPLVREIPIQEHDQLIHLGDEDLKQLEAYFEHLRSGRLIVNSEWNPFNSKLNYKSDRIVFKIPNAHAMMPWFMERYDAHFLLHVRHPIGQSLSCIKRDFKNTAEVYLNNPWFVENHLTQEMVDESWKILQSGSEIEQHVLNWCLENRVPAELAKQDKFYVSRYEDMVHELDKSLEEIGKYCDMPYHTTFHHYRKPSKTTGSDRLDNIKNGQDVAYHWKKKVGEAEEKRANEIMELFQIPFYLQ